MGTRGIIKDFFNAKFVGWSASCIWWPLAGYTDQGSLRKAGPLKRYTLTGIYYRDWKSGLNSVCEAAVSGW